MYLVVRTHGPGAGSFPASLLQEAVSEWREEAKQEHLVHRQDSGLRQ